MQELDYGVVLSRCNHQNNHLRVLSQQHGKIALHISSFNKVQHFNAGMLIAFGPTETKKNCLQTRHCSLVVQPNITTHADIIWLHHMLEASNFFIPLCHPFPDGFIFFYNCYQMLELYKNCPEDWKLIKKLCTAVLYTLFGFFPPPLLARAISPLQQHLLSSLDFTNATTINFFAQLNAKTPAISEHSIDFWLASCIQSHPQACDFKTYAIPRLKSAKTTKPN